MADIREKTIIDLETKFWQAMVDRDMEACIALMPEKSMVTGSQGIALLSHDDYRGMARQSEKIWRLKSFRFDDVKVNFPADDIAVIAYKVTEDMEVEGEPMTLQAADATTWVRRKEGWRAALHTESILGDPFGRDRKAA